MDKINAYAATNAKDPLTPLQISRRQPLAHDVVIDIEYCGVCHSDIHQARNEWGMSIYPVVPGHEIIGKVVALGSAVTRFKINDQVGVGCFVDSCRECDPCKQGMQQYCVKGMVQTYNSKDRDGQITYGGYSQRVVVDENYVLTIPKNLPIDRAAPLLCAGITTYSPLKHWKVKKGDKVAVVGLGGLGHMAVKLAVALGAEVTVFSTSEKKKEDALQFGAKKFVNTKTPGSFDAYAKYFDLMINTVSANIKLDDYVNLLKIGGTMVMVGAPEKPLEVNVFPLIMARRSIAGSLIGGIKEIQEMLNFCGEKNISSEIELIPIQKINEAYERTIKSDVRYRFVIDMKSLA